MIENISNIRTNKKAKTKKALGGIFGAVIAIIVGFTIFSNTGAIVGTIIGVAILAGVTAGVYFWLKAIDELPDNF